MSRSLYVRRLLGAVLVVAALLLVIVIGRYFSHSQQSARSAPPTAAVDVSLKRIHFTENAGDAKKWELFAESGEYDKVADRTSLKDIRFVIKNETKKGPVTVTAREGAYLHAAKDVNLRGDVFARTEDGASFATPAVVFNTDRRVLSGKERVKLDDAALTVEGIGFDFNVDTREAWIRSKVTATIYPGKRQ